MKKIPKIKKNGKIKSIIFSCNYKLKKNSFVNVYLKCKLYVNNV